MALASDSFELFVDSVASDIHECEKTATKALALIGAAFIAYKSVKWGASLLKTAIVYLRQPSKQILDYQSEKWAVIYGLQGTISEAFAHQLSNHGFNLLLVDSDSRRANIINAHLQVSFQGQTEFYTPKELFEKKSLIEKRNILILVNNLSYPLMKRSDFYYCHDHNAAVDDKNSELQDLQTLIQLTQMVLPRMIHSDVGGGLINVYVDLKNLPTPGFALYGAQQSFLAHLSHSLHEECRYWRIRTTTLKLAVDYLLCPNSSNQTVSRKDFLIAERTLQSIGARSSTAGLVYNRAKIWCSHHIPRQLYLWWYYRICDSPRPCSTLS